MSYLIKPAWFKLTQSQGFNGEFMSYRIKPIKPAMLYAFSRILVWFSELMSAL